MALTHVATTTPAFNQTNVTPTIPAGLATGDHAFLWATAKQWTKSFDPATFGGWTLVLTQLVPDVLPSGQTNGTAGQGQVRVGLFYQKVPSGGLAATTIGLTGTGSGATTLASGTISAWRSSTGADLDLATAVGYDVTTVSAFNYSADVDPGFTAGDQALLFSALSDDGPGWTTSTLTASGVTFDAVTELADSGSALGDDTRVGMFAAAVLDGTSTGAPNFSGTNTAGAGSYGGTVFLRVREAGGGGTPTVTGGGDLAASAPSLTGTGVVTSAPVTGTGALAAGAAAVVAAAVIALSGTGGLTAPSPTLSGAGVLSATASGALVASGPSLGGSGAVRVVGTGALIATARTTTGGGTVHLAGVGALTATAPALAGTGTITMPEPGVVTGIGSLTAGARNLAGAGALHLTGAGSVAAAAATLSGAGTSRLGGTGALTPQAPTLDGLGLLRLAGNGALTALPPTLDGDGRVGSAYTFVRDITVTFGPLTARTLAGDTRARTLVGQVTARTLLGTLKE